VTVQVGRKRQIEEVRSGGSYLSQNDLRLHFGLGSAARAERVEVRWPSGTVDVIKNLDADRIIYIEEGRGMVRSLPYAPPWGNRKPRTEIGR
jgi:hypothetical protein